MQRLRDLVMGLIERRGPLTDRQLTEAIFGSDVQHQTTNGECRHLEMLELLSRRKESDGLIRNVIASTDKGPKLRVVNLLIGRRGRFGSDEAHL